MPALAPAAPPGPKGRFPGDMILRMSRERIELLRTMARDFGDVSSMALGKQRIVLLTSPDDIRDVLVTHQRIFRKGQALERAKVLIGEGLLTAEGEMHLRQRRLVQPAFHRARIAAYAGAMSGAAMARQSKWRDGEVLDANRAMMMITLDIVAATLFNADVGAESTEIGSALDDVFESFTLGYGPLTPLLDLIPSAKKRRWIEWRMTGRAPARNGILWEVN